MRIQGKFLFISKLCIANNLVTRSQSYNRNLVFKKSKLVLNSLKVYYFNLDYNSTLV